MQLSSNLFDQLADYSNIGQLVTREIGQVALELVDLDI